MSNNYLEDFRNFINNPNKDSSSDSKDRVLIVDGLNVFLRNFQAVPAINYAGEHVGGVLGFFRGLQKAIVDFSPTKIFIVFDGKGGSVRRRKLFKEYKGKTLSAGSFNRFSDTKGLINETASKRTQILTLLQALSMMPIYTISLDGIEADDVIASLCKEVIPKDDMKIIMSSDKDYLHLIDRNISVYSYEKKVLLSESDMHSVYGYLPLNYLTLRCFTGDRSDNIPGVKQVGEKGLNKHFGLDNTERYITLDEIFDKSQKMLEEGAKPKIFKNIIEQKDIAYRNYELMQLIDPNISGILKSNIRSLANSELPKFSYFKLQKIFYDIELCRRESDFIFWSSYFNKIKQ